MEPGDVFDDEQFVTLLAAIHTRPGGGATEGEMQQLLEWAHAVYTDGLLLEMLLDKQIVVIGFEGNQPRFAAPEHVNRQDAVLAAEQIVLRLDPLS